jgi:hypothetical protein
MHMSKNENLDDDAIAALIAPPIRTFGDLEKALSEIEGPILDLDLIEKLRRERKPSKRPAHGD